MYRKIEPPQHMTRHEAEALYPDDYILMRMDNRDLFNPAGMVLYVGDTARELYALVWKLDDPTNCGVSEGLNLMFSYGGLVAHARSID